MDFEQFNADIRLLLHVVEYFHRQVDSASSRVNEIFLADLCAPMADLSRKFCAEKWGLKYGGLALSSLDLDGDDLDKLIHELWESRTC